MTYLKKYIGALYLPLRFYLAMGLCIVLFILSFFFPGIFLMVSILLVIFMAMVFIDYVFLFVLGKAPAAKRIMADRLSNGDDNKVEIQVKNNMLFTVDI